MKHNFQSHLLHAGLALSAITMAVFGSYSAAALDYKHVAVAPEYVQQQQIQAANTKGVFSHSTMLPLYAQSGKASHIQQKIYLDGNIDSPIIFLSPDAGLWQMTISDPSGKVVYQESQGKQLSVDQIAVGSQSFSGKQLALTQPMAGEWTVNLIRNGRGMSRAKTDKFGYLLYKGDTSVQAHAYVDNNYTIKNSSVNLVTRLLAAELAASDRQAKVAKEALVGAIDSAMAEVTSPSGKRYKLRMNDHGIKGDKVAGDGVYAVRLPTDEVGVYTHQVQIQGMGANGQAFTRTTTDLYPVVDQTVTFSQKRGALKVEKGTSASIIVPINAASGSAPVHLSAEIWGTNVKGQSRVAAWVGGVVNPQSGVAALGFDTRWLTRLGLQAPITLQSLRIQDVDTNVPIAHKTQLDLDLQGKLVTPIGSDPQAISKEMLMGKAPQKSIKAGVGSKLLLVHGYCSGQAWIENHFTDADEFQDYKQSISHDEFAKRIQNFGAQYNSYGVVAHSQGGAASLTLYSRYWSGLDNATNGRLIQSVGTPYQGTALAGNLAAIGSIFGAGCGKNTDLTYSGASNWLATIPNWAKADVNYYTTSFDTAWWSYDYCHIATDAFLDDPEDGTTEKWSGQLAGAVDRGHTLGQCHTGGMRDPSQTKDTSRNAVMSSNAAR